MNERFSKIQGDGFLKNKTRFFARFAMAHLKAFRPHYRLGETLGQGPIIWRNVSEHCLVAGVFGDILGEELGLPKEERDKVTNALIYHDWFKKFESEAQRSALAEGLLTLQVLSDVRAKDTALLRRMGVAEDIIGLTGANTPETSEGPQSLPEKIIWYVDAMLSNTNPVPIRERFDNLERGWDGTKEDPSRAERNNSMSNLYREKFGGKSMYELQRELGDKIGGEFAMIMRYQGDVGKLPLYLEDRLRERIINFG